MALLNISEPRSRQRPAAKVVGIDLGTTHSVVALVKDGRAIALADDDGQILQPSVVRYLPSGEAVVGAAAAAVAVTDADNTISSVKSYMGRGYDDFDSTRLLAQPSLRRGTGMVHFATAAGNRSPVQVSADILRHMLEIAGKVDDQPVAAAVITVPAYFDDAQRQATADAARIAGVEVLRLLNEPTAAALVYGLDTGEQGRVAVYDLGGGTFDISFLQLQKGFFQVLATAGDTALGGDDFDRALAGEIAHRARKSPQSLTSNEYRELLNRARQWRESLTDNDQITGNWGDWQGVLTRRELDAIIAPLIERTLKISRNCLADAGLTADQVDHVVLAGGATRTPQVRSEVAALFGCPPLCDLDPDQVVALGAARQAQLLAGNSSDSDTLLVNVLPLSLGIEVMGGLMECIVPRNTPIPVEMSREFTTSKEGQTALAVHVLQGERDLVSDCRSLARFELRGIPPMAAGVPRLEVTFKVDADALLRVSARETHTGVSSEIEVKPSYGLSEEQISSMLKDAYSHAEQDRDVRALNESRLEAEQLLYHLNTSLAADGQKLLTQSELGELQAAMEKLQNTLDSGDRSAIDKACQQLDNISGVFATRRMDSILHSTLVGKDSAEVL